MNEEIPAHWRPVLVRFFPDLDLDRIRIRHGLPWWIRYAPIRAGAIALPTTIRIRSSLANRGSDAELLAHELCHMAQWRRYGRMAFLVRYLGSYARNRVAGMSRPEAYRCIPFEREAREVAAQIRRDIERSAQAGFGEGEEEGARTV